MRKHTWNMILFLIFWIVSDILFWLTLWQTDFIGAPAIWGYYPSTTPYYAPAILNWTWHQTTMQNAWVTFLYLFAISYYLGKVGVFLSLWFWSDESVVVQEVKP
jgi:hypothetical protein